MHPIYILLDTTDGATCVMEAANKWVWELNSPISPGNNAKIISNHIPWNYQVKDTLYFVHLPQASGAQEYSSLFAEEKEAAAAAGTQGLVVPLYAKRYGHLVLFLKEVS